MSPSFAKACFLSEKDLTMVSVGNTHLDTLH